MHFKYKLIEVTHGHDRSMYFHRSKLIDEVCIPHRSKLIDELCITHRSKLINEVCISIEVS